MKKSERPIGIFDSGVGGLTVAKELKKILPNEDIIYFGDTQHLPYGDKSKESIVKFSINISRFLLKNKCKAIIIACNSATANALEEVKKYVGNRAVVFDVINPIAEKISYSLNQNVGVIATKATINTHLYKKSINKLNPFINIFELATPLLVPIIEEGYINHAITKSVLKTYLSSPKFSEIDTLILGCTHYPLIINEINQFFNDSIQIIDSPLIVANHVAYQLEKRKLRNNNNNPEYHFYVSDYTKNFEKLAKKFFSKNVQLQLKKL